jgi:transcriptional regulator with XRE-family HTH domain
VAAGYVTPVILGLVDGRRVGRLIRAVRQHRGSTQAEVAAEAGVSQSSVARVERGDLSAVSFVTLERVAAALEVTLRLESSWRGGDGDRLIDSEHAAVVEGVVSDLRAAGWEVLLEYTFNHYGERGSVDVLGWHVGSRALVIIEVKSRLTDLQDLLASLGRKIRIVPGLVSAERGWDATMVGRVVVMPGTTANRTIVGRHRAIFDSSFPGRAADARAWMRHPVPPGLAAIWFVSPSRLMTRTRVARVRSVRHRS